VVRGFTAHFYAMQDASAGIVTTLITALTEAVVVALSLGAMGLEGV